MDFIKCTSFNDTPLSMAPLNFPNAHIKDEEKEEAAGHPVGKDLDVDLSEVYFLIMHFLSAGPCQKTIRQLWSELGEHQLLPRRYHAWYSRSGEVSGNRNDNGSSFPLTYEEVVERYFMCFQSTYSCQIFVSYLLLNVLMIFFLFIFYSYKRIQILDLNIFRLIFCVVIWYENICLC